MKGIMVLTVLALMHFSISSSAAERTDSISIVFWNLENFFDWKDGGYSASDREFSSSGQRHWTKGRFYTKCNAIAKALMWMESEYGRMPDIAGFAEVENSFVLHSLLNATLLRKYGYGAVHYESPDPRGIDVALIYRKSVFRKVRARPVHVGGGAMSGKDGEGVGFLTRDILYVSLEASKGGDVYHILVNHHPSKYGGEAASAPKRERAMKTMLSVCDSIFRADGTESIVVCMGDFNDTPDSRLFDVMDGILVNKALDLHGMGQGTIRYRGKRELIDMFMVSPALSSNCVMKICIVPFLTVRDNAFPGEKPFRTYSGPRYAGGVSDHCPILLDISW